jgi:hypothetical protein
VLQSSCSWASFGLPSHSLTSGTIPVAPSAALIGPSNREPAYGLLLGPPTLYTHQPPALQPATCTSHSVTLPCAGFAIPLVGLPLGYALVTQCRTPTWTGPDTPGSGPSRTMFTTLLTVLELLLVTTSLLPCSSGLSWIFLEPPALQPWSLWSLLPTLGSRLALCLPQHPWHNQHFLVPLLLPGHPLLSYPLGSFSSAQI